MLTLPPAARGEYQDRENNEDAGTGSNATIEMTHQIIIGAGQPERIPSNPVCHHKAHNPGTALGGRRVT